MRAFSHCSTTRNRIWSKVKTKLVASNLYIFTCIRSISSLLHVIVTNCYNIYINLHTRARTQFPRFNGILCYLLNSCYTQNDKLRNGVRSKYQIPGKHLKKWNLYFVSIFEIHYFTEQTLMMRNDTPPHSFFLSFVQVGVYN